MGIHRILTCQLVVTCILSLMNLPKSRLLGRCVLAIFLALIFIIEDLRRGSTFVFPIGTFSNMLFVHVHVRIIFFLKHSQNKSVDYDDIQELGNCACQSVDAVRAAGCRRTCPTRVRP